MSERTFKFPLALLVKQAGRLNSALLDPTVGPPVLARLTANFQTDFAALLETVGQSPAKKASQMGNTGTLTKEQDSAYDDMVRLKGAARRTAGLAFHGNEVVLHEEFQVGIHQPQTLAAEVLRGKIILAAVTKYATQLAAEGWNAQDTADLDAAISTLDGVDLEQEASKDEGPGLTAAATADANKLYKRCLTVQNAARLQFPSTKPDTETPRARYLLGEFPPHGHSDVGGTPPTPPTA